MDDPRFDAIARALAAPRPRRALTRLLGGLAFGGALALLDQVDVDAKRKKKKKKSKKRKPRKPSGSAPPPAPQAPLTPPPSSGGGSQEAAVAIRGFVFVPATLTVAAGTTVTWTNEDTADHTATADDSSFDSGRLEQGQSHSETFATAGARAYHCTIHPFMRATVVVT